MNITDIGELFQQVGSIFSTVVAIAAGIWYLVRRSRGYFNALDKKQDVTNAKLVELAEGQTGTNNHLAKLNGSVARHEELFNQVRERIAALEGATFKRAPLPEEDSG